MKNIRNIVFILILFFPVCSTGIYDKLKYIDIDDIDFSDVRDGKYKGEYDYSTYSWKVKVRVKNGKVKEIESLKTQNTYHGIKALAVLKRVIDKQSLKVDCVTRATNSS